MEFLATVFATIAIALLGGFLVYSCFEVFVLWHVSKGMPNEIITGLEALVGKRAQVISEFEESAEDGAHLGRVFVRGESWLAICVAPAINLPPIDSEVEIIEIKQDPTRLIVR